MEKLEQLCLACGMCCDGSLFDTVRFDDGESPEKAKALGLPVKLSRAKVPVPFFRQPCKALYSDCTCEVYKDRPNQCRSFECGVFKEVKSETISLEEGMRLVKQGRRRSEKVRRLLRKIGDRDEKLSIGKRFRRVQRNLISGEMDESAANTFSELGLAMHKLDMLAHQSFYTEDEDAT